MCACSVSRFQCLRFSPSKETYLDTCRPKGCFWGTFFYIQQEFSGCLSNMKFHDGVYLNVLVLCLFELSTLLQYRVCAIADYCPHSTDSVQQWSKTFHVLNLRFFCVAYIFCAQWSWMRSRMEQLVHFEGYTKLCVQPLLGMRGIKYELLAALCACLSMFERNGAKKLCWNCMNICHVFVYVKAVGCGCIDV
jgi:hypothetical protein